MKAVKLYRTSDNTFHETEAAATAHQSNLDILTIANADDHDLTAALKGENKTIRDALINVYKAIQTQRTEAGEIKKRGGARKKSDSPEVVSTEDQRPLFADAAE